LINFLEKLAMPIRNVKERDYKEKPKYITDIRIGAKVDSKNNR